jgi:hypothetical protein
VLGFFDGRVELFAVKDNPHRDGDVPIHSKPVVWTRNPDENPNKGAAPAGRGQGREEVAARLARAGAMGSRVKYGDFVASA